MNERSDALVCIPEVDSASVAGALQENMKILWVQAEVKQRNEKLSSMLDAVLLDPNSKSVVGLVPKVASREVMLNVEPNGGVLIFDPEDLEKTESEATSEIEKVHMITMVGYGGDGGGSNSPSRTFPTLKVCNQHREEARSIW